MTATPTNGWRPKHLSHSAIEKWVECPSKYYASYVKRSPFVASRPMLIGTLFGKMIEDVHGSYRDAILSDPEKMSAVRLAAHHRNLRANERELVDDDALRIVDRMFNLYKSRDGGPYVGTPEYEFLVYLPDRDRVPVPLKGYFDLRCKDEPLIIEAKTSRWADHPSWGWTQHRVNSSPQAAIYWLADKTLNGRDSEVRYLIMGHSDNGVSMRELSTHPGMERVEKLQEDASKLWTAILEEDFPCICEKCKVAA